MTSRRRRPPFPLRALRALAAVSVLGLAGLVGYSGLRAAGFRFTWEVDRDVLPPTLDMSGADRRSTRLVRQTAEAPLVGSPRADAGTAEPAGDPEVGAARSDSAALIATALQPPRVDALRPAGQGDFASIDFERFADGRPACSPCPVDDEWAALGLRLSFRSWSADSRRPHVLDSRNFLPPDASPYALGPAFADARGLEVGVMRLDFPGRPRKVAFTLYGPDLIDRFDIAVWSGQELLPSSVVTRSIEERYRPAGRGEFRAERILVEASRGIDRISLDGWGPPGHVLLVDDLAIDP